MTTNPDWLTEIRRRAENNETDAQISLAWEYVLGEHVEKDFDTAVGILRKAETRRPALARFYLAKIKIMKNDRSFAEDLREDCNGGFGPALYLMGIAAKDGLLQTNSKEEMLEYFSLAARNNHLVSEFLLWKLLSMGVVQRIVTLPRAARLFAEIFLIKLRQPHDVRILT